MEADISWLLNLINFTKMKELAAALGTPIVNFLLKHPFVCLINSLLLCLHLYLVYSRGTRLHTRIPANAVRSTSTCRKTSKSQIRGGRVYQQMQATSRMSQVHLPMKGRSSHWRSRRSGNSCRPRVEFNNPPRMTSCHVTPQQAGSRTWAAVTTDDEEASTLNEVTWSNEPSSVQFQVLHAAGEFGLSLPRSRGLVDKLSDVPEETEKTTSPPEDGEDVEASSKMGSVEEEIVRHDGRDENVAAAGVNGDGNSGVGKEECDDDGQKKGKKGKGSKRSDSPESNHRRSRSRQKRRRGSTSPRQKPTDTEMKGVTGKPNAQTVMSESPRWKPERTLRDRQKPCRKDGSPLAKSQNRRGAGSNESPRKRGREPSKERGAKRAASEERDSKRSNLHSKGSTRPASLEDKTRVFWSKQSNSRDRQEKTQGKIKKGQEAKPGSPRRKSEGAARMAKSREWNCTGNSVERREICEENLETREPLADLVDPDLDTVDPGLGCEAFLARGRERGDNCTGVKKAGDEVSRNWRQGEKPTLDARTTGRRGCVGVMGCQLTRGSNRLQGHTNQGTPVTPGKQKHAHQQHHQCCMRRRQQQQPPPQDGDSEADLLWQHQRCPSASSHSVCSTGGGGGGGGERPLAGQSSDVTLVGKRDSWIWFSHETRPSVENFATRKHRFQSKDPRVAELAAEIRRQDEMNRAIEREAGSIADTSSEVMSAFHPAPLLPLTSELADEDLPNSADRGRGCGDDLQGADANIVDGESGGSGELISGGRSDRDHGKSSNVGVYGSERPGIDGLYESNEYVHVDVPMEEDVGNDAPKRFERYKKKLNSKANQAVVTRQSPGKVDPVITSTTGKFPPKARRDSRTVLTRPSLFSPKKKLQIRPEPEQKETSLGAESNATRTESDSPRMPARVEANITRTESDSTWIPARLEANTTRTESDSPRMPARLEANATRTESDSPRMPARLEANATRTENDSPRMPARLEANATRTESVSTRMPARVDANTVRAAGSFPGVLVMSPVPSSSTSSSQTVPGEADKSDRSGQKAASPSQRHYDVSPSCVSHQPAAETVDTDPAASQSGEQVRSPVKGGIDWEQMSCASTKASTSSLLNLSPKRRNNSRSPSHNASPKRQDGTKSSALNIRTKSCEEKRSVKVIQSPQSAAPRVYPVSSPPKTCMTPEPGLDQGGSSVSFTSEKHTSNNGERKFDAFCSGTTMASLGNASSTPTKTKCKASSLSQIQREEQATKSPHTQSLTTSTLESSDSVPKEKLSTIKQVVLNNEVKDSVCKLLFDTEQSTSSISPTKQQFNRTRQQTPKQPSMTEDSSSATHQRSFSGTSHRSPSDIVRSSSRHGRRMSSPSINVFNRDYYLGKRAKQKLAGTVFGVQSSNSSMLAQSSSATRQPSLVTLSSDNNNSKARQRPASVPRHRRSGEGFARRPSDGHFGPMNRAGSADVKDRLHGSGADRDAVRTVNAISGDVNLCSAQGVSRPSPPNSDIDLQEGITNVEQPDLLDDYFDCNTTSNEEQVAIGEGEGTNHSDNPDQCTVHQNDTIDPNTKFTNSSVKDCQIGANQPVGRNQGIHIRDTKTSTQVASDQASTDTYNGIQPPHSTVVMLDTTGIKGEAGPNESKKRSEQSCSITRMARARRTNRHLHADSNAVVRTGRFRIGNAARDGPEQVQKERGGKVQGNVNLNHVPLPPKHEEDSNMHQSTTKTTGPSRPSRSVRPCLSKRHIPLSTLISGIPDISSGQCKSASNSTVRTVGSGLMSQLSLGERSSEASLRNIWNRSPMRISKGSSNSLRPLEMGGEASCETRNISHLRKTPNFYGKAKMRITRAVGLIHDPTEVSPAREAIASFIYEEDHDKPNADLSSDLSGEDDAAQGQQDVAKTLKTVENVKVDSGTPLDLQRQRVRKSSFRGFRSNKSSYNIHQKSAENKLQPGDEEEAIGKECPTKDTDGGKCSIVRAKFRLSGKVGESGSTNSSSNNVQHRQGDGSHVDQTSLARLCFAAPQGMVVTHHNAPQKMPGITPPTTEVYRLDQTDQMEIPLSYWLGFEPHEIASKVPNVSFHPPQALPKTAYEGHLHPEATKSSGFADNSSMRPTVTCRQNVSSNLRRVHALAKSQAMSNTVATNRWAQKLHVSKGKVQSKSTTPKTHSRRRTAPYVYVSGIQTVVNGGRRRSQTIPSRSTGLVLDSEKKAQVSNAGPCPETEHSQPTPEPLLEHMHSKPNITETAENVLQADLKSNHLGCNPDSGYDETMSTTESTWGLTFPLSQHLTRSTPLAADADSALCKRATSVENTTKRSLSEFAKEERETQGPEPSLTATVDQVGDECHDDDDDDAAVMSSSYCSGQDTSSVNTEEAFLSRASSLVLPGDDPEAEQPNVMEACLDSSPVCVSEYHEPLPPTSKSENVIKGGWGVTVTCEPGEDKYSTSEDTSVTCDLDTKYDIAAISDDIFSTSVARTDVTELAGLVFAEDNSLDNTATDTHAIKQHCPPRHYPPLDSSLKTRAGLTILPGVPLPSPSHMDTGAIPSESDPSVAFLSCRADSEESIIASVPPFCLDNKEPLISVDTSPQSGSDNFPTDSRTPSIGCLCLCASPRCKCYYDGNLSESGSASESSHASLCSGESSQSSLRGVKEVSSTTINNRPTMEELVRTEKDDAEKIKNDQYRQLKMCKESTRALADNDYLTGCGTPNTYTSTDDSDVSHIQLTTSCGDSPNEPLRGSHIRQRDPDCFDIDVTQVQLPPSSSDEEEEGEWEESDNAQALRCRERKVTKEYLSLQSKEPSDLVPRVGLRYSATQPNSDSGLNGGKACTKTLHSVSESNVCPLKPTMQREIYKLPPRSVSFGQAATHARPVSGDDIMATTVAGSTAGIVQDTNKGVPSRSVSAMSAGKTVPTVANRMACTKVAPTSTSDKPTPAQRRAVIGKRSMAFQDLVKRF